MLNIYYARWNIQLREFTAKHVIATESIFARRTVGGTRLHLNYYDCLCLVA